MRKASLRVLVVSALASTGLVAGSGCTSDPAEAAVVNGFRDDEPEPWTVVKVWYRSTLFLDPLAAGEQSAPLRVATGSEPAYAILARRAVAADADGGARILVAARTREAIRISPGEQGRIVLSEATTLIGCAPANGLSKDDYELVSQRVFPEDGLPRFDPAGCEDAPMAGDAGPHGSDAASESGVVDAAGE